MWHALYWVLQFAIYLAGLAVLEPVAPQLALGLGATIEKEHAVPRGAEAEGQSDGRRPCARVAREGELSLVRALPSPLFYV